MTEEAKAKFTKKYLDEMLKNSEYKIRETIVEKMYSQPVARGEKAEHIGTEIRIYFNKI